MPKPKKQYAAEKIKAVDLDVGGCGGPLGANKGKYPYDRAEYETLPASTAVDYGHAPGLNAAYGSKGNGEPVS